MPPKLTEPLQSNTESLQGSHRRDALNGRMVQVEACGGFINIDLDGLSLDPRYGVEFREHTIVAGRLGPSFIGLVFHGERCLMITEATANSATATFLAKETLDRHLDSGPQIRSEEVD